MWRLKRLLWYGLLVFLAGILLGVTAALFEIEASVVQCFIIVCCGIYLLVMTLYYVIFMHPYRNRVLQQNADMEAGNLEKARDDIQAMQQEPLVRRSRYLTQCCQINLSAVYCRLEQYDRALEVLNGMPEKKMKEQIRLVHHLNTCICLFYSGTEQEALTCYRTHRRLFHAHRNDRRYRGNLAILECWALSAQGELAAARDMLKRAKEICNTPSLLEAYEKLSIRLEHT